jgi:hypothetical protein
MSKRGKRHTPEQIIRKLREADTMMAAGRTVGVSFGPSFESLQREMTSPTAKFAQTLADKRRKRKTPGGRSFSVGRKLVCRLDSWKKEELPVHNSLRNDSRASRFHKS